MCVGAWWLFSPLFLRTSEIYVMKSKNKERLVTQHSNPFAKLR